MKTTGTDIFLKHSYAIWLLLVLANCVVTFYNGYPVLYSDTATYLASGFELEAPADRPITYGLLLRLFSLGGLSLYMVPLCQSLIYLYALHRLFTLFFDKAVVLKYVCITSLAILLFTGFSWCLNLLLPDFFTPVGFICLYCLLAGKARPKSQWLLFVIFFIATASHISNVFSYFIIIVLATATQRIFFKHVPRRFFRIRILIATGLLCISYLIMGSAISKSKHVFMMGNLAQKGILQAVLKDNCANGNFGLCAYKDTIPRSFEYFVWNTASPLYKMGGWKATKAEYKKIIGLSFSQSKYLGMHVQESLRNFVAQLGAFGIGEGTGAFSDSTVLIKRIRRFTGLDAKQCISTQQHRAAFVHMDGINTFYRVSMTGIVLLFTWLLAAKRRQLGHDTWRLVFFTAGLMLSSAALVAFTGEVSNRYGCRMLWLIALLNCIMLLRLRLKNHGISTF